MGADLPTGFERALSWIREAEGCKHGVVDDPADAGGRTYCGITQATLDRYQQEIGKPALLVENIDDDKIKAIYFKYYWLESKACDLPWPLNLLHFDGYVQHKPVDAARVLQRAVGAVPDGIIGPKTVLAAYRRDQKACAPYIYWRWRLYLQLDKRWFRQWSIRLVDLWKESGVVANKKRREK